MGSTAKPVTDYPSKSHSPSPSKAPTSEPTAKPVRDSPTKSPSSSLTKAPTDRPTEFPSLPTAKPVTDYPSKSPSPSPTKAPTDQPTASLVTCEDSKDEFLYRTIKGTPIMKRCWWLKKRNKKKIARICVKNVNYFTDESGQAFGPAQTVCKYTCESCDPCYEDRKSKFIFEKKNGDFVNKAQEGHKEKPLQAGTCQ